MKLFGLSLWIVSWAFAECSVSKERFLITKWTDPGAREDVQAGKRRSATTYGVRIWSQSNCHASNDNNTRRYDRRLPQLPRFSLRESIQRTLFRALRNQISKRWQISHEATVVSRSVASRSPLLEKTHTVKIGHSL